MTDTTKERAPERKAAEQSYVEQAFDYVRDPIGSRDWTLFYAGWMARAEHSTETPPPSVAAQTRAMKVAVDYGERVASQKQSTETPPASDIEQLAVDLCRELYDRFMMGGWTPEDAHAETVLRLQKWAEAPRPVQDEADFSIDKDQQCRKKVMTDMQGGWLKCQKAKGHTGKCDPNGYELGAPRPVVTPEKCPTCGTGYRHYFNFGKGCSAIGRHDPWHDGPIGTPEKK